MLLLVGAIDDDVLLPLEGAKVEAGLRLGAVVFVELLLPLEGALEGANDADG